MWTLFTLYTCISKAITLAPDMAPTQTLDLSHPDLKKDEEALELETIETSVGSVLTPEEDRRLLRKIDKKYAIPTTLPDQMHRLNIR